MLPSFRWLHSRGYLLLEIIIRQTREHIIGLFQLTKANHSLACFLGRFPLPQFFLLSDFPTTFSMKCLSQPSGDFCARPGDSYPFSYLDYFCVFLCLILDNDPCPLGTIHCFPSLHVVLHSWVTEIFKGQLAARKAGLLLMRHATGSEDSRRGVLGMEHSMYRPTMP